MQPSTPFPCNEVEDKKWLEEHYSRKVPLEGFVNIANRIRGTENKCSLAQIRVGGMNVAAVLIFDDGLKWIAKAPKEVTEATKRKLHSEVATMILLNNIRDLPVPQIRDYSLTHDNSVQTPYIMMDAVRGITLLEALNDGLEETKMRTTLEGLACFRKALQTQWHPDIGSLVMAKSISSGAKKHYPVDSDDILVGNMISLWTFDLEPHQYQPRTYSDPFGFYADQHRISQSSGLLYGERNEKTEQLLAHFSLGLLLPNYVKDTKEFYLAHTDLSMSNIMVDPSDGTLTGIIDWEFANTLPAQAMEHYPSFLADKERFRRRFCERDEEFTERFARWRKYYNEQFLDDEETASYNDRIDAIFLFENLLRDFDDRPKEKIMEAFEALKNSGALYGPVPKLPWDDIDVPSSGSTVTIQQTSSADASTEQDDDTTAVKSKSPGMWKKAWFKVRAALLAVRSLHCCLRPTKE